jgi:hypothetical protein
MATQSQVHADKAAAYEAQGYYRNAFHEYKAAAYLATPRKAAEYTRKANLCEEMIFTPKNRQGV